MIPKAYSFYKRARSYANLALLITILMFTAFGSVGYHYTIVNVPREVIMDFINATLQERFDLNITKLNNDVLYSFVVAAQGFGALFGAAVGPFLAERIGRKWTAMGVQGACQIVGSAFLIFSKFAKSIELLLLGRVVIGISTGLTFATVSVYLLECSPSAYRAMIGSLGWSAILFGDAIARGVSVVVSEFNWSYLCGATVLTGFIQVAALPFMHESPKFLLLSKRNRTAAENAIAFYFGKENVQTRIKKIKIEEKNSEPAVSWRRMLKHEVYRTPLFLAITVNVAAAAAGLFAIFNYSEIVFQKLNTQFDDFKNSKIQMLIPVHIIAGIVQVFLVHRVRRRPLIIWDLGIVMVCHVIFFAAAMLNFYETRGQYVYSIIASIALIILVFVINTGVASVSLFFPAEISLQAARSKTATAGALTRMLGFLITQLIFYIMYEEWTQYVFLFFIACTALCMWYLYRNLPETSGRTLDEITEKWQKHDNRRVPSVYHVEAAAALEPVQRKKTVTTQMMEAYDIFGYE